MSTAGQEQIDAILDQNIQVATRNLHTAAGRLMATHDRLGELMREGHAHALTHQEERDLTHAIQVAECAILATKQRLAQAVAAKAKHSTD